MEILQDKLKSVLIVASERVFSTIAKHIVKHLVDDPHVIEKENIVAAEGLLESIHFDLLILDTSYHGFYCTPADLFSLKVKFPQLKIIIISTMDLPNAKAYLSHGAAAVVKKSGNIKTELSEAILAVFGD